MDSLYKAFDKFIHTDWMTTALGIVLILGVTALVSLTCVNILRRILRKGSLLPQSSIFINVVRVCVWVVGVSFMLSTCFDVNVSAIITALGVGGIAVSLGFQDTISNLIGGLTVSVSRIVEPGDNIQLGSNGVSGVVRDVTWRHTTIDNPSGTTVVIPNSIMNTTALLKLSAPENIVIPIVATDSDQRLTSVAHHMEDAAQKALARVDKIKKGPSVTFSEVTAQGFKGTLSFTLTDVSKKAPAIDAAIRAIAPFVHTYHIEQMLGTVEEEYLQDRGMPHDKALATVFADRSSTEIMPTADSNVMQQIQHVEDEESSTITDKIGAAPALTPVASPNATAATSAPATTAAAPASGPATAGTAPAATPSAEPVSAPNA